ncbi:hypothetical protein [Abyssisolibacter fermentans]|uniref:hypothetical protein n=1 Tax=Abyssisolibacter fermentans TaxID=1766203 RepID=UPI000835EC4B|nr:hypothetical protein [Abyssisolibacter fermentans]
MKKVIKLTIIVLVIILFVQFLGMTIFGFSPKLFTSVLAFFSDGIFYVRSIELSTAGPIYTTVYGLNIKGKEKVVWIQNQVLSFPKIVYSVELEKGIAKEQAIKIAEKENFNGKYEIQLIYTPGFKNISRLKKGVYWWIRDSEDNDIFIDFTSGKVMINDMNKNT